MWFNAQTNYPEIEDDGSCPEWEAFFTHGFRRLCANVAMLPVYFVLGMAIPLIAPFMFVAEVLENWWEEAVEEFKCIFI